MRLNLADDIKLGKADVRRVYQGSTIVWSRIPNDYTLCEYLESTGTQWIETDIVPKLGLWLQVKYLPNGDIQSAVVSAEGTNSSETSFIVLQPGNGDPRTYVKYFTSGGASSFDFLAQSSITLTFYDNLGDYYIVNEDGHEEYNYQEKEKNKIQVESALWLFKRQRSPSRLGKTRIYYVRSIDFCLFPCLDTSGVPCFYDTIGLKTYYNAGTGTFDYKIKE